MRDKSGKVKIFFSHAPEDEKMQRELDKRLDPLKAQDQVTSWYTRKITPGSDRAEVINQNLKSSQIILLLVSPDFVSEENYRSAEIELAMENHRTGKAIVIPILLRPGVYDGLPFEKLAGLPKNQIPLSLWANKDKAYEDVAKGIQEAIKAVKARRSFVHDLPSAMENVLPEVEQVVLKALAKDPKERYPDIKDFAEALKEAVLKEEAIQPEEVVSQEEAAQPEDAAMASEPPEADTPQDVENNEKVNESAGLNIPDANGENPIAVVLFEKPAPQESGATSLPPVIDQGQETQKKPVITRAPGYHWHWISHSCGRKHHINLYFFKYPPSKHSCNSDCNYSQYSFRNRFYNFPRYFSHQCSCL